MHNYYKYEPVELTFFKFNFKCEDNEKRIKEYYENFTGANEEDYRVYDSLGMYSYIGIRRKKENISIDTIKSFLENTNDDLTLNFYTYKVAMSHLYSSAEGIGLGEHPGAILQVQLKNNGKKAIKLGYEEILQKLTGCGAVYEVYKILGPNDFLIIFKGMRIDKIFEYKVKLTSGEESIFRRGNIILLNTTEYTKYIPDDLLEIQFVSDVRLKNNIDISSIQKLINNDSEIRALVEYKLFETLGVTDVRIQWGVKDFKIIKDIFFNLRDYISDEQTDLIKSLD